MQGLRPLRDKAETTRLLILALLEDRPGATLSGVAAQLGVTVQAVSAHAKRMAAQGRLEVSGGAYRVSSAGRQALHEGMRGLRDAVDELASRFAVIHVTSAIAAAPVAAGAEVELWMQDGDLAARPGRNGSSRGVARTAAAPGEEVIVGDLKGMVELRPGRIVVVAVPGPEEGGVAVVDRAKLRALLASRGKPDRVGAHGTGARLAAREFGPVHFEFAADHAAFNAAERGLDVHLFVSRERLADTVQTFTRLNAETLRRVPVEAVDAPEKARRRA